MNVNTRRSAPGFAPIGEVRVIGGSLKRSKLAVLPRHGLRPTPDRVRETVFNWLAPMLEGARVLDLDIILWSGGCHASPGLVIPHISFRGRRFVLHPARSIAGDWRDPVTGLRVRHLCARLTRPAANPN